MAKKLKVPHGRKRAQRRAVAQQLLAEYHIPQLYFKNFWHDGATKEVASNMLAAIRHIEEKGASDEHKIA